LLCKWLRDFAWLWRADLAEERGPLDARELAQTVMVAKGFADDAELWEALAYSIVQALRLQAKRGTTGGAGMRTG
jgi:hypothetical protein